MLVLSQLYFLTSVRKSMPFPCLLPSPHVPMVLVFTLCLEPHQLPGRHSDVQEMDEIGTWSPLNKYAFLAQLKMIFLLNEGRERQVNDSLFTSLDV